MDSLPIPDEMMVEIFLRLANPRDLVRASAACVSFRRLVADGNFLRRYRRIHAPPLLGFLARRPYDKHPRFHPAVAPHPSAPAASAIALAGDFSFSFLPGPAHDYGVRDVRCGRVLLITSSYDNYSLVVCDPLHRQYVLLPPIPDDLAASMENENPLRGKLPRLFETFLLPAGDDDEEETSFRVIWMAMSGIKLATFIFSSKTGQWRAGPSTRWSGMHLLSRQQYAYGCFFWLTNLREMLLLDTRGMEFFCAAAPPRARGLSVSDMAIVEEGEGKLVMFVHASARSCRKYTIRINNGGTSSHWEMEMEMKMPVGSNYFFIGSKGRHAFICRHSTSWLYSGCFSLDSKTFLLKRRYLCRVP
uniref:Uncharacterized protein n=1 Tax=Aegilops tauschii TaxID=37682 RepID=M8BIA6_AEGTA